ncbi:FAD/NAD(P)-binding domain-containing protein [Amniculicola lignicola CBS 123094]|uniref:FAD/NAD(P)-binding domain-containing protein n=1 Tax=Amniculicola lignicola CBS 123094 TaxID=1392246 RepID=A0A6A5WWI3_9PLEO|nr:FAD/NAD(P)-binding domain-containing protein [Amniculicola lignicola CBS 123094]
MPTHYDTLSIGSGEAGKLICWTRSKTLGVKTAVIEYKWIGGSCPNIACLPSKNLLFSASIVYTAQKYTQSGLLKISEPVEVNMQAVRERKREMVKGLIEMHESVFTGSGSELILGLGGLVDAHTVEVSCHDGSTRILTADNIVLCTGSRALIPPIPGLAASNLLTHTELLELDVVPEHLVILGAGYIGIEFAQAMRRLGAQVTVLERGPRILKSVDEDVTFALQEILESEGVKFETMIGLEKVEGQSGTSVTLSGKKNGKPYSVTASHLLVAGGRVPNTDHAGLKEAGIELTERGHVKVNEYLQTNLPNVFAVGGCSGNSQSTHMGRDDFRIVSQYLLKPNSPPRSILSREVPSTLYTSPELAHVGLTELAAKASHTPYRLAKLPMTAFLRSRTMDATSGFAKVLISATDDTILGYTVLGPSAGEMLPVVQLAMAEGLSYQKIEDLVITHPSMNEGLGSLFEKVPPRE